jgi:hypothetical protein
MKKINIGGELNPVYGRIASAEHIYDYANGKTQEKINTLLLNELYSFTLGLKINTIINGIEGSVSLVEYEGKKINASISWDIQRKHQLDFDLTRTTCPNGLILSIDNTENSSVEEMTEELRWTKVGSLDLVAGRGITTATMKMDMEDGFSIIETAKFYLIPPIYYGFSPEEEIHNPKVAFSNKLVLPSLSGKRLTLTNDTGGDAYFYICLPRELGITKIELTSSGFKVPFDKVLSENTSATDLDIYDCWRNPTGSRVLLGSEIEYDVK